MWVTKVGLVKISCQLVGGRGGQEGCGRMKHSGGTGGLSRR